MYKHFDVIISLSNDYEVMANGLCPSWSSDKIKLFNSIGRSIRAATEQFYLNYGITFDSFAAIMYDTTDF